MFKITELPELPGVYLFKDAAGKVIYIGKAKSLKKRVSSYFNRPLDAKSQALVSKIKDLEYRITPSESAAQIQEAALIKEYRPQYNIDLKDDKSFPWIKISAEDFPVLSIHRRRRLKNDDQALYFGPYTDVKLLRQAVKAIRRIFGFRSCRIMPACRPGRQEKICLYGRIHLCPAPCVKRIKKNEYAGSIEAICLILEGRSDALIEKLSRQMAEKSKAQDYEAAAKLRDQISALSLIGQSNSQLELEDLKSLLRLKTIPQRIEAFDISNISGQEACGAMVSFLSGFADRNNYRRFRIKTVKGVDDFAMTKEIVLRRYCRLINEHSALPDLILIDGGKAHLLTAYNALKELKIEIPLVSIAKEEENIYTTARTKPIKLNTDTPALNLIRRVRDEAHRFAVTYHHILRRKRMIGR